MSITNVVNVAGSIGGIASSATNLANLLGGPAAGSWAASLRPASYGTVKFGVESSRTAGGRKGTVHDYPYRDDIWFEDQGKKARSYDFSAFLVENDPLTGGGAVIAQRDSLLSVCDTEGPWVLVHPTYGTIKSVACLGYEVIERTELGRVFEVRLNLIVTGKRLYPVADLSTYDESDANASALQTSALANFVTSAAAAIRQGAAIVQAAVNTALGWYQYAVAVVNSVKSIIGAVTGLAGNFGLLFGGGNDGYAGSNPPAPAGATVDSLLIAATVSRAAVVSTGAAVQTAMADPSDSAAVGAAIQAHVAAVAAASADPSDAVRSLLALAQYQPVITVAPGQLGTAIAQMQTACGALFRRYALAQLAIVAASYQPVSQEDAAAMIETITAQIDVEITVAGDAGDDASYDALRTLRQGVVSDLQSRGANLATVAAFSFQANLPSLALANRIYRDIGREAGLVQQAAPIHPAFMPRRFHALAK